MRRGCVSHWIAFSLMKAKIPLRQRKNINYKGQASGGRTDPMLLWYLPQSFVSAWYTASPIILQPYSHIPVAMHYQLVSVGKTQTLFFPLLWDYNSGSYSQRFTGKQTGIKSVTNISNQSMSYRLFQSSSSSYPFFKKLRAVYNPPF